MHLVLEADDGVDLPVPRPRDEVVGAVSEPLRQRPFLDPLVAGVRVRRREGGGTDSVETGQAPEEAGPLVAPAEDRLDPPDRGHHRLLVLVEGERGRRPEQGFQGLAERGEGPGPAARLALEREPQGALHGLRLDARPGEDPAKTGAGRPVREQGEEDDLHPDRGESDSGRLFSRLAEHPLPVWILPLAELSHGEEIHPCPSLVPMRAGRSGRFGQRPRVAPGAVRSRPERYGMVPAASGGQGGRGRRRAGIGIDRLGTDRLVGHVLAQLDAVHRSGPFEHRRPT